MNNLKVLICTVFGMLGSFFSQLYGGWDKDMTTLITCMAIDFIMGLVIAVVFKKSPKTQSGAADSMSCFRGLCKKCVILLFVLLAHRLDVTLGVTYIKTAAVIGFIVNEVISIIENAGIMGIPLPKAFTKALELLKKDDEDA